MASLQNRLAFITGAAGELGSHTARRLRADGANLILLDMSPKVHDLTRELTAPGFVTEAIEADIGDADTVQQIVGDLLKRHGCVDILVNNAGITLRHDGKKTPALEISLEDWNRILAVNLTAPFLLSRGLVPAMMKKGWGRVINMSSLAGRMPSRFNGMHYSASKAGMIGMTRTLALEVSRAGVTVNAIAPGRIETPANRRIGTPQEMIDNYIPVGRLGTADDISAAVAYLASDAASYITGITLDVNGGFFMG